MRQFKLFVAFMLCFSFTSAYAQSLCQVSGKSRLAMDQRDDLRLKCLKQKKAQLNVSSCLNIAKKMEYSTNAEEARLVCLYDLRGITIKECHAISKSMEYADTGDEVRWECLRRFNRSLTKKQCTTFAKSMAYPANTQRAEVYCAQELE
ncbi:hypothetical protein AZI85_08225 [Bdellovibrio bacteriovorus]|uniref:Uncharacterized protein n=1 Tax=Bdellovibrio bacteriovorus TaxID=959 RepID=A0A150WGV4_BDEBC|nr:hypothetical protein [Bdellovibrio bacteriovorus]KYG62173.1 hypothetical protein AZI85_08225 [Bdellovibrio bacteriovorus]